MGPFHSPPLDAATWVLILFCHRQNISFVPVHIPGKLNVVADQGSRQGPISTEWMLDPESFESICQEFPFFPTVDLFATRATSRLTCYVSPCPDPQAFHQDALDPFLDWNQFHSIYAFPPPGFMPFLIQRIVRFRGAMLLIAPLNLNSCWIVPLLDRASKFLPLPENHFLFQFVQQEIVIKQSEEPLPLYMYHILPR